MLVLMGFSPWENNNKEVTPCNPRQKGAAGKNLVHLGQAFQGKVLPWILHDQKTSR